MRWYDQADTQAWKPALGVFIVSAVAFAAIGLSWWSLLTALSLGLATFNLTAARRRRAARSQRGRNHSPR